MRSKPSGITQQTLVSTSETGVWNPLVEAGPIRRPCSHQIACEKFKEQMIIKCLVEPLQLLRSFSLQDPSYRLRGWNSSEPPTIFLRRHLHRTEGLA